MSNPNSTVGGSPLPHERRDFGSRDHPLMAGVHVRDGDVEPTRGLHSIAILFRVLAGLLGLIVVLQVLNTLTMTDGPVSFGILLTEVIRLVIFAGLLWGAGDLADLLVESHRDLRATRILLGRLVHHFEQDEHSREP